MNSARKLRRARVLITTAAVIVCFGMMTNTASAQSSPNPSISPAPSHPLEMDKRLDRAITITTNEIQLDELLHHLSTKDFWLTCDRSCASQKLQLRLIKRPLRTLMQSLMELLPGVWQAREDGHGYRLVMSDKAVTKRETWWRLYLGEWERAKAAQRAYVLKALRGHDEKPLIDSDASNDYRQGLDFFHALPAALQDQIADQMMDYAFITRRYSMDAQEGAVVTRLADLSEQDQNILLQTFAEFLQRNRGNSDEIYVRFVNAGWTVASSLFLSNGKETDAFLLHVGQAPDAAVLSLYHPHLPIIVKQMGKDAPAAWRQLAAYQESRVWPNDLPVITTHEFPPPCRSDSLQWLGDQANIEFVSDYYSKPCRLLTAEDKQHPLTEPVASALNRLAVEQDLSWKQRPGNIYLVRNNRWYRDDALEVPDSLLRDWLAQLMPAGSMPMQNKTTADSSSPDAIKSHMDLAAQIVSLLSPWQIAYGLEYLTVDLISSDPVSGEKKTLTIFPFVLLADSVLREYDTARLYADLNDSARRTLVDGRLPLAALNPSQLSQAQFLLPALKEDEDTRDVLLALRPANPRLMTSTPVPAQGAIHPGLSLHLTIVPNNPTSPIGN